MSSLTPKAARRIIAQHSSRATVCAQCRRATTKSTTDESAAAPADVSSISPPYVNPDEFDFSQMTRPEVDLFHNTTRLYYYDAEFLRKTKTDIDRVVAKAEMLRKRVNTRPTSMQINKKIPAYKYTYVYHTRASTAPKDLPPMSHFNSVVDAMASGSREMKRHLDDQLAEPYRTKEQKINAAVATHTADLKATLPKDRLEEMTNKQASNAMTTMLKAQSFISKLERLAAWKADTKAAQKAAALAESPEASAAVAKLSQAAADALAKSMLDLRQQSEQQDRERAAREYAAALEQAQQSAEVEEEEEIPYYYDDAVLTGSDLSPGWGAVAPVQAVVEGPAKRIVLPKFIAKKVPLARTTARLPKSPTIVASPHALKPVAYLRAAAPPVAAKWQKAKPAVDLRVQRPPGRVVVRPPSKPVRRRIDEDPATRSTSPASILGLQETVLGTGPTPSPAGAAKKATVAGGDLSRLSLRDQQKIMEEETM